MIRHVAGKMEAEARILKEKRKLQKAKGKGRGKNKRGKDDNPPGQKEAGVEGLAALPQSRHKLSAFLQVLVLGSGSRAARQVVVEFNDPSLNIVCLVAFLMAVFMMLSFCYF